MKMSMVEPGYWDGFVKGVPGGEEDFSNLLNILDFPMESLEGDDELAGDWDASNSQSLGPIPLDALMGLPPVPHGSVRNDCLDMLPKPNVPVAGTAHKKQLPDHVKESSRVIIPHVNAISETQESRSFQTHSPVSVLESGGSCSGGKSLPIKPDIVVPGGTRSKRARASPFNPWFVMTPISYAVSTSKKTSSYKKNKEKKKELSQLSHALNNLDDSFQQAKEELFHAPDATEKNETSLQHSDATKKCTHCEVTKTPQWREGPMGPKTLCNACGVRYRSGRLFPDYRPAASPTFVPTLHSRVACTASASKKTLSYKKNKEKKKKKKKLPQLSPPLKDSDDSFQHAKEELFHASDVIEKNETSMQCSGATKKCTHCEVTKTPQWREGPMGPKTLCNACGVRYRSGRLFPEYRPAASPTFVPTLHSNSHRKVIEMRKQAMHETAIVHDAPMSPTPEFVPMSSYLFNLIY